MMITPLIDFFLPRLCLSCGNKLEPIEDTVCPTCLSKFRYAEPDRIKCEYDRKFLSRGYVYDFASLYLFERNKELQNVIHSLKYDRKFGAGIFLGKRTAETLAPVLARWEIDAVIPVPLHRLKTVSRGYNQSKYIALGISSVIGKPLISKAVIRKKNTLSQTKMSLKEREDNIRDAFCVRKTQLIKNKNILLVDDVITTGSTLNECARVLLKSASKKVYAVSPAIADLEKQW